MKEEDLLQVAVIKESTKMSNVQHEDLSYTDLLSACHDKIIRCALFQYFPLSTSTLC